MLVEMKIKSLTVDPSSKAFVILLSDLENKHGLPIGIGAFEGNAIALKLQGVASHPPMTHDLIRDILGALNSKIVKIEVMDVRDNTYYALIHVKAEGKEIAVDSRPSDAIALALGTGAPIYVTEEVLSKAKTISLDQLEEWLESFDPEDFRYKA